MSQVTWLHGRLTEIFLGVTVSKHTIHFWGSGAAAEACAICSPASEVLASLSVDTPAALSAPVPLKITVLLTDLCYRSPQKMLNLQARYMQQKHLKHGRLARCLG